MHETSQIHRVVYARNTDYKDEYAPKDDNRPLSVTIIHIVTSSENIVNKCGIIYLWNNAHISVALEMRPTEFVWISIDDRYRMGWFTGE